MKGKGIIERFFDVKGLSEDAFPLLLKFFTISALFRMISNLTSTIYILYFFDSLGFEKAGIVIAVGYILQSAFDFPTGVLSDRLGQKKVLLTAYCGFILSLIVLSFANSFNIFLLANAIFSLALAQQSGALETWFDNKYKLQVDNDADRKLYGAFLGKAGIMSDIFGGVMLLVGGYLVFQTSRTTIFRLQAICMVVFVMVVFLIMDESKIQQEEKLTIPHYGYLLKKGFSVIHSSGSMFFFVFGIIIYGITMSIFGDFVMFPSYRGYVANDFQANAVRFSTWCFGTIFGWITIGKIRHLDARKSIPKISLFHDIYLFSAFGTMLYFYPIKNSYVPEAAILAILLISSTHSIRLAKGILLQRVYLDLIPDEHRNSFYSLMPTLTFLFTAPVAIFAGLLITNYGHYLLMYFLGVIAVIGSLLLFATIPMLQPSSEEKMETQEPKIGSVSI